MSCKRGFERLEAVVISLRDGFELVVVAASAACRPGRPGRRIGHVVEYCGARTWSAASVASGPSKLKAVASVSVSSVAPRRRRFVRARTCRKVVGVPASDSQSR